MLLECNDIEFETLSLNDRSKGSRILQLNVVKGVVINRSFVLG
jgi:hypothetical protein